MVELFTMKQTRRKWRFLKGVFILAVLGAVCTGLLLLLAPALTQRGVAFFQERLTERGATPVRFATGNVNGSYHRLADLLSDTLNRRDSFSISMVNTAGAIENVNLLKEGAADFAFVQGASEANFEGLRSVASLDRELVHIVVPADSTVTSLGDLSGKRVSVGPVGSGSSDLGARLFAAARLQPPPVVVTASVDDMRVQFQEGTSDAAVVVCQLHTPFMRTLLEDGSLRLAAIREVVSLSRDMPGSVPAAIPQGAYGPNLSIPTAEQGDLPTLAVDLLLLAREDTPSGQVRAVLDSIFSTDYLRRARLTQLTEIEAQQVVDAPLHRAANTYYRRNNPMTSDRFEIASFFIAALVVGVSAFQFLAERRRQAIRERRRLAIVPYFEAMVTFGNAVENTDDAEQLTSILHSMMSNHRRAEEEWLDDDLDTEHMENLYAVYNIRSRNAFNKIFKMHLSCLRQEMDRIQVFAGEISAANMAETPGAKGKGAPKPRAASSAGGANSDSKSSSNAKASQEPALPDIVLPPPKGN
jgi:TRAP transporter TAXI family solute receptor